VIDVFFIASAAWLLLGLVLALLLGRVIRDADQRETQPESADERLDEWA
jgi:NhaP-type Na+/H+ or K+/H+ antiporter